MYDAQHKSPTLKMLKTEKLRNTNMLDKCRNITLAENRWQT